MKSNPATPTAASELRRHAKARFQGRKPRPKPDPVPRRRLHELQVHQTELEMQNKALQHTRTKLEATLKRHTELYDFAPVGYLALDRKGAIRQANLMAASLLAADRACLLNRRLVRFVAAKSRSDFDALPTSAFASQNPQIREVELSLKGKRPVTARLQVLASEDGKECRVVLSNITECKPDDQPLCASEDRYRTVVEDQTEVICRLRVDGTILFVNDV